MHARLRRVPWWVWFWFALFALTGASDLAYHVALLVAGPQLFLGSAPTADARFTLAVAEALLHTTVMAGFVMFILSAAYVLAARKQEHE
jgi:hypothetical protein